MTAAVSGFCGGGWHYLCFGNVQQENGQWVYCSCPEPSCVCYQQASAGAPNSVAGAR